MCVVIFNKNDTVEQFRCAQVLRLYSLCVAFGTIGLSYCVYISDEVVSLHRLSCAITPTHTRARSLHRHRLPSYRKHLCYTFFESLSIFLHLHFMMSSVFCIHMFVWCMKIDSNLFHCSSLFRSYLNSIWLSVPVIKTDFTWSSLVFCSHFVYCRYAIDIIYISNYLSIYSTIYGWIYIHTNQAHNI